VAQAAVGYCDRVKIGLPGGERTARQHVHQFVPHRDRGQPVSATRLERVDEWSAAWVAKYEPVEYDVGIEHQ